MNNILTYKGSGSGSGSGSGNQSTQKDKYKKYDNSEATIVRKEASKSKTIKDMFENVKEKVG